MPGRTLLVVAGIAAASLVACGAPADDPRPPGSAAPPTSSGSAAAGPYRPADTSRATPTEPPEDRPSDSRPPSARPSPPGPPAASESSGSSGSSASPAARPATSVPWLPPGPAAPANPPPYQWYGSLEDAVRSAASCPQTDHPFWSSLAAVCRAAWTNRPADWAAAERAASAVPAESGCLEAAAVALRTRLLEAHRQDPRPLRIVPAAAGGTACPVAVTAVTRSFQVYDPGLREVTGPACGSLAGGWQVTVEGTGLGRPDSVAVGGVRLRNSAYDAYPGVIIVPDVPPAPTGGPGTADVVVTVLGRAHSGTIRYSADAAACVPGGLPTEPPSRPTN